MAARIPRERRVVTYRYQSAYAPGWNASTAVSPRPPRIATHQPRWGRSTRSPRVLPAGASIRSRRALHSGQHLGDEPLRLVEHVGVTERHRPEDELRRAGRPVLLEAIDDVAGSAGHGEPVGIRAAAEAREDLRRALDDRLVPRAAAIREAGTVVVRVDR